jgi:6-phospho-beta-glucosidase
MNPAVAILGGSTPFTASLFEELRNRADLPACELRLFGQDEHALSRMRSYALRRLPGWTVEATSDLRAAVRDAGIVVNQIRFGGLTGRAGDEEFAARFQLPADETLGAAGFRAALRIAEPIRELGQRLRELCPNAWVLNLANPLSVTTAEMLRAGAPKKTLGLCELPFATAREACRLLEVPLDRAHWQYAGLNHRGFVFSLRAFGEELLPALPARLGERTVFGVTGEDVRKVGALPLKYFKLASRPARRAAFVEELRGRIALEIDEGQDPPPSLLRRNTDWYRDAVVPMISAIFAGDGREQMINALRGDLVVESRARIFRDRWEICDDEPPAHLRPALERTAAHERSLLAAVQSPSFKRIEAALALDPAVPAGRAREIAEAIWEQHAN